MMLGGKWVMDPIGYKKSHASNHKYDSNNKEYKGLQGKRKTLKLITEHPVVQKVDFSKINIKLSNNLVGVVRN